MNDRRFIELLNLYVDQQISVSEAAELEAEVAHNPPRQRTYADYCRLQRACGLLGERARSLAPASAGFERSMREVERKIASPRRPLWQGSYIGLGAGVALAACVAVVVVTHQIPSGGQPTAATTVVASNSSATAVDLSSSPMLAVASVQVPTPAVVAPTTVVRETSPVVNRTEFPPMFAAVNLGSMRTTRENDAVIAERAPLEWMDKVHLTPVQPVAVDDQAFESRSTLQPDNRVFRGRHAVQGNAEFTAFQFQR